MKRWFAKTVVFLLLLTTALSGCAGSERGEAGEAAEEERKISIVSTIFPQYDWTRQILGERAGDVELTLLLNSRIDLHNYQPSVDDMIKISGCDLFVYVGGESDGWVEEVLESAGNDDMIVVNLLDALGSAAKTEEIIEGMAESAGDPGDHGHSHSHGEEESLEQEAEYDEHVWLSLKNAQLLCSAIADALSALDAGNAEAYQSNLAAYLEELSTLDAAYQAAVNAAPVKTLLFGDRFPFRYLTDDYGLRYYAAFAGCSAETEASFETIIFLAEKMDELRLTHIMVTESSDQRIAETIRNNTVEKNQQILVLDAMQSVTLRDISDGASYLSIMVRNLDVLKEALRD